MLVDLGAGPVGQTVALVLAQDPRPPAEGEEFGKASPVALVVIVLLGLATILLVRSMSKRIKRLPRSFDDAAAGSGPDAPAERARSTDTAPPER